MRVTDEGVGGASMGWERRCLAKDFGGSHFFPAFFDLSFLVEVPCDPTPSRLAAPRSGSTTALAFGALAHWLPIPVMRSVRTVGCWETSDSELHCCYCTSTRKIEIKLSADTEERRSRRSRPEVGKNSGHLKLK